MNQPAISATTLTTLLDLCHALPTPMERSALFHILQGNLAPQSRQLLIRAVNAYISQQQAATPIEQHAGLGDK